MRILVCTPHLPYPPRGGGRADIWRRIEAFTQLGHSVMLLHQYEPSGPQAPLPGQFEEMDQVLAARYSWVVRRSVWRTVRQLLSVWRRPSRVSKVVPTGRDRAAIDEATRDFDPDLVWLDGPWLGELARRYHDELGIPIAYRSHNVEHVYLRRQARASTSVRDRVAWTVATIGLKRYELTMMHLARHTLDISLDDLEFWRTEGVTRISWLPPLPELALGNLPDQRVSSDIVFVGGLRFPNNVQGVRWLIDDVLPHLRTARPDVTVAIVGSTPSDDLRVELEANPAVRTYFDVPSVNPYLFGAQVLVNPVSIGSGVQLKMLDMLMTDAPIVTRTLATRGLPSTCVSQFTIADDPEDFAKAILAQLESSDVDVTERAKVRDLFTVQAVKHAIDSVYDSGDAASTP